MDSSGQYRRGTSTGCSSGEEADGRFSSEHNWGQVNYIINYVIHLLFLSSAEFFYFCGTFLSKFHAASGMMFEKI